VEDIICKGALLFALGFTVFIVYCCVVKGAMQDEIDQDAYDEYCRVDGDNDDSVHSSDER
jgi:hypothetical protein